MNTIENRFIILKHIIVYYYTFKKHCQHDNWQASNKVLIETLCCEQNVGK